MNGIGRMLRNKVNIPTPNLSVISATIALALAAQLAIAETHREPAQRSAFTQQHPCPSTLKTKGRCPGYVVDHIKPLCAGGADSPEQYAMADRSAGQEEGSARAGAVQAGLTRTDGHHSERLTVLLGKGEANACTFVVSTNGQLVVWWLC